MEIEIWLTFEFVFCLSCIFKFIFDFWSYADDNIYLERRFSSSSTSIVLLPSRIAAHFELDKFTIIFKFNEPTDIANYNHSAKIDSRRPMRVLKEMIAQVCD